MTQFSPMAHRKWKWGIVRVTGGLLEWERNEKGLLGLCK